MCTWWISFRKDKVQVLRLKLVSFKIFLLEINIYTILCIKQAFLHMHTYTAIIKSHHQRYLIFKTSFGAIDITNSFNWGAEKNKQKSRKTTITKREHIYQEKAAGIAKLIYPKEFSEPSNLWPLTTVYWMHTTQAAGFSHFIPFFPIHTHLWTYKE